VAVILLATREYRTSPLYYDAQGVALDFALAAASQPNDVTGALLAEMRRRGTDGQTVAILGVVSLFGFLNRWNDTMATPLEPTAAGIGDGFSLWTAGRPASTRVERLRGDGSSAARGR